MMKWIVLILVVIGIITVFIFVKRYLDKKKAETTESDGTTVVQLTPEQLYLQNKTAVDLGLMTIEGFDPDTYNQAA